MIIRRDFQQGTPEWYEAKRGVPSASGFSRIITSVGKRCVLPRWHQGPCMEAIRVKCGGAVFEVVRGKTKEKVCALNNGHRDQCMSKLPAGDVRCPKTIPQLSEGASGYIAELIADTVSQNPTYFTGQGHPIRRPFSNEHTENGMQLEHESRLAFEMDSGLKTEQVGLCLSDDGRFAFSPDALILGHPAGLELKCPALHTQADYLLAGTLPSEYRQQVHGALAISGFTHYFFYSYSPPLDPLLIKVEPDEYTVALKAAMEQFWNRYMAAKTKLLGAAS